MLSVALLHCNAECHCTEFHFNDCREVITGAGYEFLFLMFLAGTFWAEILGRKSKILLQV
jgi:hypothetical protein